MQRKHLKVFCRVSALLMLAMLANPQRAEAAIWFQLSINDGPWSNAANWNAGGGVAPPGTTPANDFAFISGGRTITLQAGDSYAINWCSIGHSSQGNGSGVLNMTGGTLSMISNHALGYDELYVGDSRGGTLNQSGGSLTVGGNAYVGKYYTGNSAASAWNLGGGSVSIGGNLHVGLFEQANNGVANAAFNQTGGVSMVSVAGDLVIGSTRSESAAQTFAYNLGSGGTLTVGGVVTVSSYGMRNFIFNGGTLKAGATQSALLSGLNHIYVSTGGAVIDSNGKDIGISQALEHTGVGTDGGLTKLGGGTLTLSGNNTYNGSTTVSNGILRLTSAGALAWESKVCLITTPTAGTVDLAFSGTNQVCGLSIDGTPLAKGVYGSNDINCITGGGYLKVETTRPPVANFTALPTNGYAFLAVSFTDTSTPGSGTISGRFWIFGDGKSATTTNTALTHTYTSAGTNTVTLTVTDSDGLSNSKSLTVVVEQGPTRIFQKVDALRVEPSTGYAALTITPTNGVKYRIVYNDDLLDTGAWAVLPSGGWKIGTGNGLLALQDTSAAGVTQRFYRIEAEAADASAWTPVPGNAEWLMRHGERVATVSAAAGALKLLFVGDSITIGWLDNGKAVWDADFAPQGAVSIGIAGSQTAHLLWQIQNTPFDNVQPKAVVMLIGANNLQFAPLQSADDIALGIGVVVQTLRERLPQSKILLMGTFPRDQAPGTAYRLKIQQINAAISHLDDGQWIRFLDIGGQLLDKDGYLTTDVAYDGLHLTAKGYRIWSDAIKPVINEMIAQQGNL